MALGHEKKDGNNVRDIAYLIGENGPWQRNVFLVTFCIAIPLSFHVMIMSFFAPNLQHWCARPPGLNISLEEWKTIGLPPSDQKCSKYVEVSRNSTLSLLPNSSQLIESCDRWEYDETHYGSTLLSKFNLVCDREWFVSLSKSIYIAGFLVSVILFGYLSDKFGRKPVIAGCNLIALVSAAVSAFSSSFLMFAIGRFFIALGCAGAFTTTFVLMMEVVGSEYRSVYGMSINFGWCVGYISLPGIVYLLKDWFWTQIAITTPFICLIFTWWILPESPRWLLMKGRLKEARAMVTSAAQKNNIHVPDVDDALREIMGKTIQENQSEQKSSTIFSLLRIATLRGRSINVFFIWFVTAFVYFGLSFNTNELAGDPYVNFTVSGIVEVPAYIIALFVIRTLGRRGPQSGSLIFGGVACLLLYPLPEDPWWLGVAISMLGKTCVTASFGIMYVYTSELFPTVVRNQAVGMCSLCGRLGSIMAPFVKEIGDATHPVMPQVIFGVLSVTSGLLVLLLPETMGMCVPDTLEEAAAVSRKRTSVKDKKDDPLMLKELCIQSGDEVSFH